MSASEQFEIETIYVYRTVETPAEIGEETLGVIKEGIKIIKLVLLKILVQDANHTNDELSGTDG